MAKEKYDAIRVAKQMPYITAEDIRRMKKEETSVEECYRIMRQRRMDW